MSDVMPIVIKAGDRLGNLEVPADLLHGAAGGRLTQAIAFAAATIYTPPTGAVSNVVLVYIRNLEIFAATVTFTQLTGAAVIGYPVVVPAGATTILVANQLVGWQSLRADAIQRTIAGGALAAGVDVYIGVINTFQNVL